MAAPNAPVIVIDFSAADLKKSDRFSKSDPLLVLSEYSTGSTQASGSWREVFRTECVANNQSPDWQARIEIPFIFQVLQQFRIQIFDWDTDPSKRNAPPNDQDFLGEAYFTMGELVHSPAVSLTKSLAGPGGASFPGNVRVRGQQKVTGNARVRLQFCAHKLDNKDGLFGKSDPFLVIYKRHADGSPIRAFQSEVISNNLNPVWKPFEISLAELCNGDENMPLEMHVIDYDDDGSHDMIGKVFHPLAGMQPGLTMQVINEAKQAKKKSYQNSGTLEVIHADRFATPSFLDYMYGGLEISMAMAVDFTASNGNPAQPTSLHHMSADRLNEYQLAIHAIGHVLEPYDADRKYAALGFGGKLPDGSVSHCFNLLVGQGNQEVAGVQGILDAYEQAIQQVTLYGPTNFSPIIQAAGIQVAQQYAQDLRQTGRLKYHVLVMLTDGVITDMQATVDAIVHASSLPLSIIIVGVGNADFGGMQILDADDGPLRASSGQTAVRDIVQFVPFRKVAGNPAALAGETLQELPSQVVQYFMSQRINPPAPPRQ